MPIEAHVFVEIIWVPLVFFSARTVALPPLSLKVAEIIVLIVAVGSLAGLFHGLLHR